MYNTIVTTLCVAFFVMKNSFEVLLSGATRIKKQESKKTKEIKERNSTLYYLGYVGEIGFTISVPIVLCLLLGRFLDQKWLLYPKMTLGFLFIGITLSIINFIQIVKTIIQQKN